VRVARGSAETMEDMMAHPGSPLSVMVQVDPRTFVKTLAFSRPVTPAEASQHLFAMALP